MCNRVKAFIPGHQNRCRCMYSFIIRLHVIIFSESDIVWKDVTDRDRYIGERKHQQTPALYISHLL